MPRLLDELKKRNVIRVALMYLSAAWLLAQLVTTLGGLVALPAWVGPVFLIVLAVGFVMALLLAWHFDLTDDGLHSESEIRRDPALRRLPPRYLDFTIIALLTMALGYFIWQSRDTGFEHRDGQLDVAVLPVRDISATQDQSWFANGLTEELTRSLIAIPELRVIGRSTVAKFDPAVQDAQEFGARIGVSHVIDSSVNSDGRRVRVSSTLVRVNDGFSIWSDAFDGDMTNLLQIQDQIAGNVTRSLQVHLRGEDESNTRATSQPDIDFPAYRAYLQGRYHLARRTPEDLDAAVAFFKQSLALDPVQSMAHSGLATVYAVSQFYSSGVDPVQLGELAERHANAAIAIDEHNAEAHAILGSVDLFFRRDWDRARIELGRAYELAPGDADILNAYGDYFYYIGDFESALEYEGGAAALEPLSAVNQLELGLVYGFLERYDDAIRQAELASELNGDLANAWWQQCRLHLLSGDVESARDIFEIQARRMGASFAAQARVRLAMAEGNREEALQVAAKREAAVQAGEESHSASALLFALAGNDGKAAEHIRHALDAADGVLNSPMYFFLPENWADLPKTRDALDRPELQGLYRLRRSFREATVAAGYVDSP